MYSILGFAFLVSPLYASEESIIKTHVNALIPDKPALEIILLERYVGSENWDNIALTCHRQRDLVECVAEKKVRKEFCLSVQDKFISWRATYKARKLIWSQPWKDTDLVFPECVKVLASKNDPLALLFYTYHLGYSYLLDASQQQLLPQIRSNMKKIEEKARTDGRSESKFVFMVAQAHMVKLDLFEALSNQYRISAWPLENNDLSILNNALAHYPSSLKTMTQAGHLYFIIMLKKSPALAIGLKDSDIYTLYVNAQRNYWVQFEEFYIDNSVFVNSKSPFNWGVVDTEVMKKEELLEFKKACEELRQKGDHTFDQDYARCLVRLKDDTLKIETGKKEVDSSVS